MKMTIKIKTIKIRALRGIPDLTLKLDGKNLLLCGETGTGKSSLVDAIEFFFTGKISCLEGVMELSLHRHGSHVGFEPDDVSVEIIFNPGNVSLTGTFTSAPSAPQLFEDYFQIAQKGTFILHRSQILTFIMSQPAERFRAIGSIIGTEPLDEVELEMMRLRDHLEGEVNYCNSKIDDLINELSTVIGKNIVKIEDVLPALNEILQEGNLPLIKSLEDTDIDKHAEEMLRTVKKAAIAGKINMLVEISEATKTVPIPEEVVDKLNSLNDNVKHLLQKHVRLELTVAELLESGQKIIMEEKIDVCPLCGQEIDREKLLAKINNRLETLRDLSGEASKVRTMSIPVINKLNETVAKLGNIVSKIELFPEVFEEKRKMEENLRFLSDFVDMVTSARDLRNEIPIQVLDKRRSEINEVWRSLSAKCERLLDIEVTEEEKKILRIVGLIAQARSKIIEISRAHSELGTCQKYYKFAKKIYSAFSETKKAKIQEIYNSMQSDMQSFYSILHPNDPHKNIALKVAFGRRASTKLEMESFGREGEDPRAFASEGHLDSLGLCIFLAFVRKFNEGCSLIILDDVVATIDAKHRERICKLLFEKFEDKQLILTTHDELWYEQLCAFQRDYGVEGKFENLVIVDWDVNTGPIIRPYKPRWERIQEKIAQGDKRGAGNEGRQYLEWLLEKICETTRAPVPFKSSKRYMVGDLLIPAKKRVDELIKDDAFKQKISQAFSDIERTIIMGNILSHNNPLAERASIEEVKSFCDYIHELHSLFLCPNCGRSIAYYRELKILRCSNPNCENHIEIKTTK